MPDRGFIETPPELATVLATNTIQQGNDGRILYPGVGRGRLRTAAHDLARRRNATFTEEVAVDIDQDRLTEFHTRHEDADAVTLLNRDFLKHPPKGSFEYIVMNPPYIRYSSISAADRRLYRHRYRTAEGRFNTYMLFMEAAYSLLAADGALTAVIPLNWLYNEHDAFVEWVYRRAPHVMFPVPPDIFDAKIETVVINLYGPAHQPDRPHFSCTRPHPYDVMDLEGACTFDDQYWEWTERVRRCARSIAEGLPEQSAFSGDGEVIGPETGHQSGFERFGQL